MNWKFWKKDASIAPGGAKIPKLDKPKDLPELVGRKMVVDLKLDPDMVWSLKYVSRPTQDRPKTSEFRIYNPGMANQAGLMVKNWHSLDNQPDLVMFSGFFDKIANRVDIHEG